MSSPSISSSISLSISPSISSLADALQGIRVLDLSRLLPGPFLTMILADLGADVVKIEDPRLGDYMRQIPPAKGGISGRFLAVNRGKRSAVLDLKLPAGRDALLRMAAKADVVIESFRPGVMDRLGVGYAALAQANPGIILCSISGFGQTGPYVDRAGHDIGYLAIAGVLAMGGPAGGAPMMPGVQIADLAGGGLTCVIGILAALHGARATGAGSFVDVSMTDGSAALQVIALASLREHGKSFPRGADILSGALPNYTVYKCRDGRYLAVGALEPKFMWRLFHALWSLAPAVLRKALDKALSLRKKRDDGGAAAPKPSTNAFGALGDKLRNPAKARRYLAPLRLAMAALFRTRPRNAWVKLLADTDACVTPVLTLEEALNNEQLRAREMVVDDGGKPAFALPIRFSDPAVVTGPSPELGEHNGEILGR